MKIIVIGDESRYQFLRKLMEKGNIPINLEIVKEKGCTVTWNIENVSENVYYSSQVPLYTEVEFPTIERINQESISYKDAKLLIFDEQPYQTEGDVKLLNKYRYKGLSCEIILVLNNRKAMDSDVSSEQDGADKALEYYQNRGFRVHKYVMGEAFDFFLYEDYQENNAYRYFKEKLKEMEEEACEMILSMYELKLKEYDLNKYISSDPAPWNKFFPYYKNISDIVIYSTQNAFHTLMKKENEKFTQIYEDLYKELYKSNKLNIECWNLKKDKEILYQKLVQSYRQKFKGMVQLSFKGDELEYTKWMTDEGNKKIIIEIKNKLGEFIEKDAGDIIRKYMLDRINRMEEVLNGKVY